MNAFFKNKLHCELPTRDPRFLIGLLIVVIWTGRAIVELVHKRHFTISTKKMFLGTALVATYIVWISVFGVYRYAIIIEIVCAIMLFIEVDDLIARGALRSAAVASTVGYASALLLTSSPELGHVDVDGGKYFSTSVPAVPTGSMVINLTEQEPMSYLVPLWPGKPAFVSPITNLSRPGVNPLLQSRIAELISDHKGPLYILEDNNLPSPSATYLLDRYQLQIDLGSCTSIQSIESGLVVCSARRSLGFELPTGSMIVNLTETQPLGDVAPNGLGKSILIPPAASGANAAQQSRLEALIAAHRGSFYVLQNRSSPTASGPYLLDQYQLVIDQGSCRSIANPRNLDLVLCRAERKATNSVDGFEFGRKSDGNGLVGAYPPGDPGGVWTAQVSWVSFSKAVLKSGAPLHVEGDVPYSLFKKAAPSLTRSSITISINGTMVASRAFDRDEEFSIAIPSDEIRRAARNHAVIGVEIQSSNVVVPARIGGSPDTRSLGVKLSRVSFGP